MNTDKHRFTAGTRRHVELSVRSVCSEAFQDLQNVGDGFLYIRVGIVVNFLQCRNGRKRVSSHEDQKIGCVLPDVGSRIFQRCNEGRQRRRAETPERLASVGRGKLISFIEHFSQGRYCRHPFRSQSSECCGRGHRLQAGWIRSEFLAGRRWACLRSPAQEIWYRICTDFLNCIYCRLVLGTSRVGYGDNIYPIAEWSATADWLAVFLAATTQNKNSACGADQKNSTDWFPHRPVRGNCLNQ